MKTWHFLGISTAGRLLGTILLSVSGSCARNNQYIELLFMKNKPWIPRAEARGGKGFLSLEKVTNETMRYTYSTHEHAKRILKQLDFDF